MAVLRMRSEKYAILWPNRRNFHVIQEIGVEEPMVTSDFTPKMEIWPFRTCAMKNVQYNPYLRPNRRNSRML